MEKEKVSVIIPTYNRAHILSKSVSSVLEQTYTNLQLLIVDDCSTDQTPELVASWQDPRITYVRLGENHGAAGARNEGAKLAQTEWIAFHDSDDIWLPDKLEKQMRYAVDHPEYELIYCGYRGIHESGKVSLTPKRNDGLPLEGNLMDALLFRNTIGAPTMLLRRGDFLACGGFDTEYHCLEDWEFAIRFARDHRIGFVDENLVDAYISESGVSSQASAYFESRCRMLGQYYEAYEKANAFSASAQKLLEQAATFEVLDQVKNRILFYITYFRQNPL